MPVAQYKCECIRQRILADKKVHHVWVDGCCLNNGRHEHGPRAGAGIWWGENDNRNRSIRVRGAQTNNRAELLAAIVAINMAYYRQYKTLRIYTDSDLVYKTATIYLDRWRQNGYTKRGGHPIMNQDLVMQLDAAMSRVENVQWEHVRAHQGNRGNEEADKLAKMAANMN